MSKKYQTILITAANSMLAIDLIKVLKADNYHILATTKQQLDITNNYQIEVFFAQNNFDLVINCAAYTNVDKAETEKELAFLINEEGAKNLAIAAAKKDIPIIYISTDYVFDGEKKTPYLPSDKPNPINVYGASKLAGEVVTIKNNPKHFIIRTSWLYASHGKNFVNTMLELAKTQSEIRVVNDQIGCPTSTIELSEMIKDLIEDKNLSVENSSEDFAKKSQNKINKSEIQEDETRTTQGIAENKISKNSYTQNHDNQKPQSDSHFGIYHYCGQKSMSWFDFAKEIFKKNNLAVKVIAVSSDEFPRPARRPKTSYLN